MFCAFMCKTEVLSEHVGMRVRNLTALFHGFIRPVFAVFHVVTHLAAVDTLAVLTAELPWPVTLCNWWGDNRGHV